MCSPVIRHLNNQSVKAQQQPSKHAATTTTKERYLNKSIDCREQNYPNCLCTEEDPGVGCPFCCWVSTTVVMKKSDVCYQLIIIMWSSGRAIRPYRPPPIISPRLQARIVIIGGMRHSLHFVPAASGDCARFTQRTETHTQIVTALLLRGNDWRPVGGPLRQSRGVSGCAAGT